ncbi:MAG TPA: hypothetical protein DDW54_01540 [Clostridiales bacterium]|nr:hypothetical protein [Clostridiales bacterium]
MKKVLLIGDSIRKGYDTFVKLSFKDKADVFFPSDNCRFAGYVFRNLIEWKNNLCCGNDVDVVHWNAGLWDCLIMFDEKPFTPLDLYIDYVDRACKLMKKIFPKAKMIFATSTPVREKLYVGDYKRFNSDIELYNEKAIEVIKKNGGEINDLYNTVKNCPVDFYSDMTHLYTEEGTRLVTDKVISVLEKALGVKANKLNYKELFSEQQDVTGL